MKPDIKSVSMAIWSCPPWYPEAPGINSVLLPLFRWSDRRSPNGRLGPLGPIEQLKDNVHEWPETAESRRDFEHLALALEFAGEPQLDG